MADLRDIEIFYPGTWNALPFSDVDMVEMVNNSNLCLPYTEPHLSLDHSEVAPVAIARASFGAVAHFRLKATDGLYVVLCTFRNVKRELAELVKFHYPRRSIELYPEYPHPVTKEIVRNVICGVSFLGAKMPPAVKGMFPDFVLSYHDPARRGKTVTIVLPERSIMSHKKFADGDGTGQPSGQTTGTPPASGRGPGITPTTNELGLFVATRRAELGLTEAQVAERVNAAGLEPPISDITIHNLEQGIILPADALLVKLSGALEMENEALRGLMTFPSQEGATLSEAFSEQQLEAVMARVMRKLGFQEDESLGAYLRRMREERDMSLDDLAVALEVTSEEIAAIEDAAMPSDALLTKYAALFEVDEADLKARRDAMQAASDDVAEAAANETETPPAENAPSDNADAAQDALESFADRFEAIMQRKLHPLQRDVEAVKRERDTERQARETQDVKHFLERLETQYHASKVVTGPKILTLLMQADATRTQAFAEGQPAQTPRACLMQVFEDIARQGNITVPTEAIVPPGTTPPAEPTDLDGKILRYQEQHGIKSYQVAARRFLHEQHSHETKRA